MAVYNTKNITNLYWACNEGFKVGRDPMGIQNCSITLYGQLLPGMTNQTGHIRYYSFLLLSGKTFWGISVLVKIDLTLLFLRIIGYYRSFLIKISAFYNTFSLKQKTKPLDG